MLNAIYPIIGSQSALPFYLTGVGISDPEYHVVRGEGLVSHQFHFTAEGRGILKVGGNSYIQTAGSIFYLSPGVPHEYYPDGERWTTCWAVFRGEHLAEQMRALGFTEYAVKGGCTEQIRQIFSRLMAAARDPVSGAESCSELIYEYILAARELFRSEGQPAENTPAARAVSFMEEHYSEDVTLEQLAALSGISLQHFCRLFRQLLVIGINQKIAIQWDFPITYEMARAYQKANGKYLRQNQWEDITLVMSLELGK